MQDSCTKYYIIFGIESNIFSIFQSWGDFSFSPSASSCSLTSNLASNNVFPVETASLDFVLPLVKGKLTKIDVSPRSLCAFHAS